MCLMNVCKIKIIQKKKWLEGRVGGMERNREKRTRKDGGRVGRRKQAGNGRNQTRRVLRHRSLKNGHK